MTMKDQRVLCLPRAYLDDLVCFTPWETADWLFQVAQSEMRWLPRDEAEASEDFVQPIPCALVLGAHERHYVGYHVFPRVNEGRSDLRKRLSLIIGGHIDWDGDKIDFPELIKATLTRELQEELDAEQISPAKPIGLVVDHTSIESSRHIGLVHEVLMAGPVRPTAPEEFSARSKYAGQLWSVEELLSQLTRRTKRLELKRLDPWSSIIFSDYIAPEYVLDIGRQRQML